MEKYMKIAIKEAKKAQKHGDIPVGAVIVKENKVIAKSHNRKEKKQITTRHAEIEVIEKACKKLKTWRLDDCEIYVTMEPCCMCYGAIEQARIKKIYFGIKNEKFGYISKNISGNVIDFEDGMLREQCVEIVQKFFLKKRV